MQFFSLILMLQLFAAEAVTKIVALGFIIHPNSYLRDGEFEGMHFSSSVLLQQCVS
jgi:hypothetical protein